jgi:hypothetical protein
VRPQISARDRKTLGLKSKTHLLTKEPYTNLRVAYGHGRYARGQESKTLEFFTFSTMGDGLVRPSHHALDGTTLPKKHVFWTTHKTAPGPWLPLPLTL